MSKAFKCLCCGGRHNKNFRLKVDQNYCGLRECQNARKKKWDRIKRQESLDYRVRRRASNRKWRAKYPCHKYQKEYREAHPEYCEKNCEKQVLRNENRKITTTAQKIVKTDALTSESVVLQGYYVLLPYKKAVEKTDAKKIVKTDALIVQIVAGTGFAGDLLLNSS